MALVLALGLPARGLLMADGSHGGGEPIQSRPEPSKSGETARASGDTSRWPFSREPSETPQDVEKLLENLRIRRARANQDRASATKIALLEAEAAKLDVRLRISKLRKERDDFTKSGDHVRARRLDGRVHELKGKLKELESGAAASGHSGRIR